jgi:hypothetical protein
MRQAGFTAEELDILALAKAQSDRLTQIEREAMAARDARGPDALERQARAVQMLHDATYLAAKAAILGPHRSGQHPDARAHERRRGPG